MENNLPQFLIWATLTPNMTCRWRTISYRGDHPYIFGIKASSISWPKASTHPRIFIQNVLVAFVSALAMRHTTSWCPMTLKRYIVKGRKSILIYVTFTRPVMLFPAIERLHYYMTLLVTVINAYSSFFYFFFIMVGAFEIWWWMVCSPSIACCK